MMIEMQLELNLEDRTPEEMKLIILQKQIEQMGESMGKVRKKLFSEMGEVKKICHELLQENELLKFKLREIINEKTEWVYGQEGYLVDVRKTKKQTS